MRVVIKRTYFQKNYKRLQPLELHDLTLFTRQIDKSVSPLSHDL